MSFQLIESLIDFFRSSVRFRKQLVCIFRCHMFIKNDTNAVLSLVVKTLRLHNSSKYEGLLVFE